MSLMIDIQEVSAQYLLTNRIDTRWLVAPFILTHLNLETVKLPQAESLRKGYVDGHAMEGECLADASAGLSTHLDRRGPGTRRRRLPSPFREGEAMATGSSI